MLSKQVQDEVRAEIARLRSEADALESILRSVGGEPQKRGPGRPRKDASAPSPGKVTRNWSAASRAASANRIKAMWKAAKAAGFNKLGDFTKSKAGKAWAEKNA